MLTEAGSRLEKTLELLFPPKCIFCNCILEPGRKLHICEACFGLIPFSPDEMIRPGRNQGEGCDGAVSLCRYSGIIKDSLIRFKFYNKPGYYRTLARMLSDRLGEFCREQGLDLIACVPLHRERQRSRGYNQAALLARELSREIRIPKNLSILSRVRKTGAQSLLPGRERDRNVRDAFKVNQATALQGKSVLLVDDVLTTGSTVNECSRVLKEAGAIRVMAAVIATGRKY